MSARLEHTTVTRILTVPTQLEASRVPASKDILGMECLAQVRPCCIYNCMLTVRYYRLQSEQILGRTTIVSFVFWTDE